LAAISFLACDLTQASSEVSLVVTAVRELTPSSRQFQGLCSNFLRQAQGRFDHVDSPNLSVSSSLRVQIRSNAFKPKFPIAHPLIFVSFAFVAAHISDRHWERHRPVSSVLAAFREGWSEGIGASHFRRQVAG
jgi:hypothetical protein